MDICYKRSNIAEDATQNMVSIMLTDIHQRK